VALRKYDQVAGVVRVELEADDEAIRLVHGEIDDARSPSAIRQRMQPSGFLPVR